MLLLIFLATISLIRSQSSSDAFGGDVLSIPYDDIENDEEEPFQKEIFVLPNHFPKDLNFFCYPRNELMRDRICFGQIDAFALACSEDTPPIQLVPFCIAFKKTCSKVVYPSETFCDLERTQYKKFCTRHKRQSCKSCYYDLSCSCEPYECIWRRYGFETAAWCQRYELYCNENKRREKGTQLVSIMQDAIKVHYKCFHLFNLANIICDPFRRQYDQQRCMKFLFDCELISDFKDEEERGQIEAAIAGEHVKKPKTEDEKAAAKISEEEQILEQLIADQENMANATMKAMKAMMGEKEGNGTAMVLSKEEAAEQALGNVTAMVTPKPMELPLENPTTHPFERITLPSASTSETPSPTTTSKPAVVNAQELSSKSPAQIAEEEKQLEKLIQEAEAKEKTQSKAGADEKRPKNPFHRH